MDWSGEVQQSVQAGGYVAVIRSTAVFETESEARTALDTALGRIVSPKPGDTVPAGAETRRGTVKWYNPKSGSCSWSGFAEALVELGDERICRGPRGSPCG